MNYKTILILLSSLFTASVKATANEGWKDKPFALQAGYGFSAFNTGSGHTLQLGVCKPKLYYGGGDGVLSTLPLMGQGFSAGLAGLLTDGNFYPGVKLGYEAQLLLLGAKAEVTLLTRYVFFTPSIGLGIATKGGIYAGYNICINDNRKSGFQVSFVYNFLRIDPDNSL